MKRFIASLAAALLLAAPLAVSASTLSDLQAQLQSLLSQVSAVQQQIAALQQSSTASSTPSGLLPYCLVSRVPRTGSTDAATSGEVSKLQKLLAQTPSLYPEGLVTGYFGPATGRAISRLQNSSWCKTSSPASSQGGVSATTSPAIPSTISIDRSTLFATTSTPTVKGGAQNLTTVILTIDAGGNAVYKNDSVPVTNGIWSITATTLLDGAYKVTARSPGGNAAASGYLIVSTVPAATSTPSTSTPNPYMSNPGSTPIVPVVPSVPPTVHVSANGSTRGASVVSGGGVFISWNAEHASTCTISSDHPSALSGSVPTYSSGVSTGALTQTTVFTVSCTGASGSTTSGSVTVTVLPQESLQKIPLVSPLLVVPVSTLGE